VVRKAGNNQGTLITLSRNDGMLDRPFSRCKDILHFEDFDMRICGNFKKNILLVSLLLLIALSQHAIIFSSVCKLWFQIYFEPRSQSSGDDALHSRSLQYFVVSILLNETSLRPFRSSSNNVKIESHEKCHQPIVELMSVSPIERGLSKFCGIVPAYWNFLSGQ
jgi:hypothetical protein